MNTTNTINRNLNELLLYILETSSLGMIVGLYQKLETESA